MPIFAHSQKRPGRWLGAFIFMLTILAATWVFPILLNQMIDPGIEQGLLISGYLGIALCTSALVAVGVAVSSIFSNQIAAFFTTLGVYLVLWLIGAPAQALGGTGSEILTYLAMGEHYYGTFFQGIIEISDIVYYLSLSALALFPGTVSIETRRWR